MRLHGGPRLGLEEGPAFQLLPCPVRRLGGLADRFQQRLQGADAPGPGDETVADKGVTVLVDRKASLFLIGTTMDYEVKALSSGFTFVNPNEKGRCGCGESFHV